MAIYTQTNGDNEDPHSHDSTEKKRSVKSMLQWLSSLWNEELHQVCLAQIQQRRFQMLC